MEKPHGNLLSCNSIKKHSVFFFQGRGLNNQKGDTLSGWVMLPPEAESYLKTKKISLAGETPSYDLILREAPEAPKTA